MYKNIFIMGPGRVGKTTLSKLINKRYGYSISSIDDILVALRAFPQLQIDWEGDHEKNAEQMAEFLAIYLKELAEGNKFYDGCKTVIEGTDIDFERLMPKVDRKKYLLIGLTYDQLTKEELFKSIRKHDTEDDWTYYMTDEQLMEHCAFCIRRNTFFRKKFQEYGIPCYDTSKDRETVLKQVVDSLQNMAD